MKTKEEQSHSSLRQQDADEDFVRMIKQMGRKQEFVDHNGRGGCYWVAEGTERFLSKIRKAGLESRLFASSRCPQFDAVLAFPLVRGTTCETFTIQIKAGWISSLKAYLVEGVDTNGWVQDYVLRYVAGTPKCGVIVVSSENVGTPYAQCDEIWRSA